MTPRPRKPSSTQDSGAAAPTATAAQQFKPVESVRAYQLIADSIEEQIVSGALKPGDRLPSERELVVRFGSGRSTIREALRVLESNRLVRSRPGDPRGPEILPFSADPMRKSMQRLAAGGDIASLLEFRMVVEPAANLLAAVNRTDAQLLELERANARMNAAIDLGSVEFSRADFEFHRAVAVASGNPLLAVCAEVVQDTVVALISTKIDDSPDERSQMAQSVGHHAEVFAAIRDGHGRRAGWLSRDRLFRYYGEYVPEPKRTRLQALVEEFDTP